MYWLRVSMFILLIWMMVSWLMICCMCCIVIGFLICGCLNFCVVSVI